MLYGMDDDDYKEEFSHEEKKLNIKKVIIVAIIFLIIIFLIVHSIVASVSKKHIKNKGEGQEYAVIKGENIVDETENKDKEEKPYQENNENSENNENNKNNEEEHVNEEVNIDNSQEEKDNKENKQKNKNKDENIYEGNHMQIPEHDTSKVETKFVPVFNENAPQLIKDIYYSDEKQVYLTFDDGPSKDITPQILDILKENNVPATFFVLGSRVELYPDMLKRENEEGHYIANHGYSHKYSQIYQSKDSVFEEYRITENAIKNALNNQDFNTYLFRFPGGSSGGRYESIKAEARDLFRSYGIAFTNWNCLTGDAENKTTREACINEMIRTKANQNSIILLMHDANDKIQTVEALPGIIEYFRNEGYTFKNFYEIFK